MVFDKARFLGYFRSLGEVEYEPCSFNGADVQYATIVLCTTRIVIGNLEKQVNSVLDEHNGFRAFLRVIAISDLRNGKYEYAVEIVPRDEATTDEKRVAVTEHFLHSLPRVVRNFRCKYNPRRK